MPSTYTVNLGIEKPATGEQSGTWGDTTNINFDILDQAINGAVAITLASAGTSGSPNTLAISDGAVSDGRNKWIEFVDGGDLGATAYVQLTPNDAEKIVFIRNSLSGSRSVILFQGTYDAARDLEVPAGVDMVVKFSGGGATATATDVFTRLRATAIETPSLTATTADINGGTVDGATIGGATPAAGTFTNLTANTDLTINSTTTVDGILDEDNMASNSATKLATQQSIKAYVDSQVGTVDTLAEILANGNTSGANNLIIDNGQAITTNTINETTAGSGVTIDSVLLKDDGVNATNLEITNIKANDGTAAGSIANSTGAVTITSFISNSVDIGGGAIDDTVIGGTTPAAVSGTTGTFSGNLTVDTNTLFVDAANNRVGVGTSSPTQRLDVRGGTEVNAQIYADSASANRSDLRLQINNTVGDSFITFGDSSTFDVGRIQYSYTSDHMGFITNSSERMRIDSSGRVGIGTTTINDRLVVASEAAGQGITIRGGGFDALKIGMANPGVDNNSLINVPIANALVFGTNNTERMRIDSSGRVGIGTSSPAQKLDVRGGTDVNAQIYADSASANRSDLRLRINNTVGDSLITFGNSSAFDVGRIQYAYAGNTMGFFTNSSERMRLDTSGNLLVGTTTTPSSSSSGCSIEDGAMRTSFGAYTGSGVHIYFINGNGTVGSITSNGSATAYNTSSDYRLKENVVPMSGAADRLAQIPVHRFNFIADPDTTVDGFLAHEVQDIVPEAITGTKDEVDADGNPVYQGIDQSKLVPLLTAALQEALTEIAYLKARVAALEA